MESNASQIAREKPGSQRGLTEKIEVRGEPELQRRAREKTASARSQNASKGLRGNQCLRVPDKIERGDRSEPECQREAGGKPGRRRREAREARIPEKNERVIGELERKQSAREPGKTQRNETKQS